MGDETPSLEERQFLVRERELALKEKEFNSSRWASPIVLGIFAAALGLLGNIWVAHTNNINMQEVERVRGQSNLIVEAIKTNGDTDAACNNLRFFVKSGLVDDKKKTIGTACPTSEKVGYDVPSLPADGGSYRADPPSTKKK